MFKILIILYLFYSLSIIMHELFHLLSLLIMKKNVNGVFIGESILQINVGKLYFSPLIKNGYVDISVDQIENMNGLQLAFFFFSGIVGNIILMCISFFIYNPIFQLFIFYINSYLMVSSIVPFINKTNDLNMFLKYYKNRKRR